MVCLKLVIIYYHAQEPIKATNIERRKKKHKWGFSCYNKEYRQVIYSYTYIGALSWLRAFPSIKKQNKIRKESFLRWISRLKNNFLLWIKLSRLIKQRRFLLDGCKFTI